jgi:hypothetical protein
MAKLLLTSVLFATVLIPLWTSRDPVAERGAQRTVLLTVLALAGYLFATVVIYNRL